MEKINIKKNNNNAPSAQDSSIRSFSIRINLSMLSMIIPIATNPSVSVFENVESTNNKDVKANIPSSIFFTIMLLFLSGVVSF